MRANLIVALARDGIIGKDNAMPWHLPADLAWFRRHTFGHPVIMGRKTFESIGRPLPGRRNVVLTRDPAWRAAGVETHASLDSALASLETCAEAFVIGGAQLYAAALPRADRLFITFVDATVDGDTRFPPWRREDWRQVVRETRPADARNPYAMEFAIFERVHPATR
jgi:dihydrofolate reductase